MSKKFQLPGAEHFSQYLERALQGELMATTPILHDNTYKGIQCRSLNLILDGEVIGQYLVFGSENNITEHGCAYEGKIPGYVAPGYNPPDTVLLEYNRSGVLTYFFLYKRFFDRFDSLKYQIEQELTPDKPLKRHDAHDQIPFP